MRSPNDPFFPEGLPAPVSPTPAALPAPLCASNAVTLPRRPSGGTVPDLPSLLRAFRSRWGTALVMGLLAGFAAGALAWRLVPRPKFTASTIIEVKAQKPNLLPGVPATNIDLRIFQATQVSLVHSRLVLESALEREGIRDLVTIRKQPEPLEWLDDSIVAEFSAGSELMRVSLSGDNAGDITALVNAVSMAYLDEVVTKDYRARSASLAQLQKLLDQYNERLTRQRSQLREMAQTVGSDDRQTLALKQQWSVQQLAEERRELGQAQADLKRDRAESKILREAVEGRGANRDPNAVDELLDRDPTLARYREQVADSEQKLDRALRLVRSESDPSVRLARQSLERARRAEASVRRALLPKIERELAAQEHDATSQRLNELETRIRVNGELEKSLLQGIERLENESRTFNRQTIDLQWKKDEIAQGEEIARQLYRQIESLTVDLEAPKRGELLELAEGARVESRRKWLAALLMATLSAFGVGVLGVSLLEYRVRRVTSADELADGLGLRLVGTLPRLPASNGRAARGDGGVDWQQQLIESIDAARTVILRDCRAEGLRSIMVTSATKGEGKSSLAGHLAISLARTGRRVLLLDLDLRNPAAHRLFDVPTSPGASELLRGEATLDDVVNVAGQDLDVVAAGTVDVRALRALGQNALPELLARLEAVYEFVVIDTAPVLPVADSLLISQHVDSVLLAVFHEVSRFPSVHAAHERLAALGARMLGAVVTGTTSARVGVHGHYASVREG